MIRPAALEVMSLSGKLRASPDGWGESSQPGAGSTGHTTRVTARETDLVHLVQGELPGLGQGAIQPEALHPWDRP